MVVNDITINVTGIEAVDRIEEKIKEATYNLTGQLMSRPGDNYSIAIKTLRDIAQSEEISSDIRVRASELLLNNI